MAAVLVCTAGAARAEEASSNLKDTARGGYFFTTTPGMTYRTVFLQAIDATSFSAAWARDFIWV